MRYALSDEPRFRALMLEVARELQAQGLDDLTLRLHGDARTHRIPVNPDRFSFEDRGAHAGVDCRVCATRRDRRFALFVMCAQGQTHGPIGSRCLFEHVLGERGRDIARRLDEIARDAVHNTEHALLLQQAGDRVAYLEGLGLAWCLQNALLSASLAPARVRDVLAWRGGAGHLPRALYRALMDADALLKTREAPPKAPAAAVTRLPVSSDREANRASIQARAHRLGAHAGKSEVTGSSKGGFATEPISDAHAQRLRDHLAFIEGGLSNVERGRLRQALPQNRVPTQDVPRLVFLLSEAISVQADPWFSGRSGAVRRAAWPEARVYLPEVWQAHAERFLTGAALPEGVALEALQHHMLLALDLYVADQAAAGVVSPLRLIQRATSRSLVRHLAWVVAWAHGCDQRFTAIQRPPITWRLQRRSETYDLAVALESAYAAWFEDIQAHDPERLPVLFGANVRAWCAHQCRIGETVDDLTDHTDQRLTTVLAPIYELFLESGCLPRRAMSKRFLVNHDGPLSLE